MLTLFSLGYLETKRGYKVFDSIDIQCEILPLSFEELSQAAPGESSATIRERVIRARHIQEQRFANINGVHCNAQMTEPLLHKYCKLSPRILRTPPLRHGTPAALSPRIQPHSQPMEQREESQVRLGYSES